MDLSDDISPVLQLQGVPWIIGAAISKAPMSIALKLSTEAETGAVRIDSTQTSLGQNLQETRILDWAPRDQSHVLFGTLSVKARRVAPDTLPTDVTSAGPTGSAWDGDVIELHADGGAWTSITVWGFATVEGCRRHVRFSVVTKGDESKRVRLVYDWVG